MTSSIEQSRLWGTDVTGASRLRLDKSALSVGVANRMIDVGRNSVGHGCRWATVECTGSRRPNGVP